MGRRGDFLHFFLHFRFYCGKIGPEPPKNRIYVVTFGVHGTIAQLVEQMTFNHWVQGSSPCGPTTNKKTPKRGDFLFVVFKNIIKIVVLLADRESDMIIIVWFYIF